MWGNSRECGLYPSPSPGQANEGSRAGCWIDRASVCMCVWVCAWHKWLASHNCRTTRTVCLTSWPQCYHSKQEWLHTECVLMVHSFPGTYGVWCFERLPSFIGTFICCPMYPIQNQLCNCEIENSFVSVCLFSLSKQLCLFKEASFIWKQSSVTLQLGGISIALPLCFPWHILKHLLYTPISQDSNW